jgi:hypothetical protein
VFSRDTEEHFCYQRERIYSWHCKKSYSPFQKEKWTKQDIVLEEYSMLTKLISSQNTVNTRKCIVWGARNKKPR